MYYSPRFNLASEYLLGHEGGYVNDPNDSGGKTKYGISKRSYPDLNISALTWSDAKAIYWRDFWHKVRGEELPAVLAFVTFDASVNSGVPMAIKWMQTALGVSADGVIGPITIQAARGADSSAAMRVVVARWRAMGDMKTYIHHSKGWGARLIKLAFQSDKFYRAMIAIEENRLP